MKHSFKISLITILFINNRCAAQSQEAAVLIYNSGFGSVTSGIGAIINKPKGTNWKNAFIKGVWQGSIGGALNYLGKRSLYLVNRQQNIAFALPARLLHSAGLSIMNNAALCEPFLKNWNIDYGPVRFDFSIGKEHRFKARFLPQSIVAIIDGSKGNVLDLKTSLFSGTIAFVNSNRKYLPMDGYYTGMSYGRSFAYMAQNSDEAIYNTIPHEIVHIFQYEDYQVFNTWLKPLEKKVKNKIVQKIFSTYIYFDFPYFFPAYNIAGTYAYPHYYKNFFEFEAERCSSFMNVMR